MGSLYSGFFIPNNLANKFSNAEAQLKQIRMDTTLDISKANALLSTSFRIVREALGR